MSTVTRVISDPERGNGDFIFNFPVGRQLINRNSGVWATICELGGGDLLDTPFIGAARMSVRNVAPKDDGVVDLWIQIEWPTPLNYRVQLLVSND